MWGLHSTKGVSSDYSFYGWIVEILYSARYYAATSICSYALVGFSGSEHGNCCICVTFTSNNSLLPFLLNLLQFFFQFCRGFWVGGVWSPYHYKSYINLFIEGANIRPTQVLPFFPLPNVGGECDIGDMCSDFLGPFSPKMYLEEYMIQCKSNEL